MNTRRLLSFLVALFLASSPARSQAASDPVPAATAWPAELVERAGALPVQDGGRVKPLDTFASFTLLRMNGRRSLVTPDGRRLTATEWLLDVLLRPEQAAEYRVFQVQDVAAVREVGGPTEGKKKRDRYSFAELRPVVFPLLQRAREYAAIEEKERSSVQQQVYLLAESLDLYIRLTTHFDFARERLRVEASAGLTRAFGGREEVSLGEILASAGSLRTLQEHIRSDPESGPEQIALARLLQGAFALTSGTESLALFPPTEPVAQQAAWYGPTDLLMMAVDRGQVAPEHLELFAAYERLASAPDTRSVGEALATFHAGSTALAAARGEQARIGLERTYYKAKLIDRGLYAFVLGFLLVAFLWLRPRARWLYGLSAVSVGVGTVLVTIAIVLRCLIRERPPVSTLYETVLFVTATGALSALVMEWINRQRIALSAAAVLGVVGLFIANGYETLDKRDTMPQLVAVLDTNFWLATHVTAITVGYSAGILAALLANVYLVAKLLGLQQRDPRFGKGLIRMVYGAICFGLTFSVVGTILGGVWANESWGRFWGWDPKENGALLICLSQLVLLHLRQGGHLRDFGVAMVAAFGGTVIGFSWWGVNLLGVGLHSYGFTSGIHTALWSYYLAQWSLLLVAGAHHLLERSRVADRAGARSRIATPAALRLGGERSR